MAQQLAKLPKNFLKNPISEKENSLSTLRDVEFNSGLRFELKLNLNE